VFEGAVLWWTGRSSSNVYCRSRCDRR